jgi:hypothetical protein
MSADLASDPVSVSAAVSAAVARPPLSRFVRTDRAAWMIRRPLGVSWPAIAYFGLALVFVIMGAIDLDLGPLEARLGLAAGERFGPMGQVLGYWAVDLWPAQVLPSMILAQLEPLGRPTSAAVRWPAALAGILAGWILVRRMRQVMGTRGAVVLGVCWLSSLALIDRSAVIVAALDLLWKSLTGMALAERSAEPGLDLILGLATLASIDLLIARGSNLVAGLWAALAFLAGGWPGLIIILLAMIVLGRKDVGFSWRLLLPPLVTAGVWSLWTYSAASAEVATGAFKLPFLQKPSWFLALTVLALGLPWSPFALLSLAPTVRRAWGPAAGQWIKGWFHAGLACLIAGTIVPGLDRAALVVALAGFAVLAAACLESAWAGTLSRSVSRVFFTFFSTVTTLWLCITIYCAAICCVMLPYYRMLGILLALVVVGVVLLGWSALQALSYRRAFVTLFMMAFGLKLLHWGYYVPEWNYRNSQGPWARAIAQWIPKRWTLYTFHDWPADLAFFTKRAVRQLPGPHHLEYQAGPASKYVLLLPSELEYWPDSAPRISVVAKFEDQWAGERILARTAGVLPPPFGPNRARLGLGAAMKVSPTGQAVRR